MARRCAGVLSRLMFEPRHRFRLGELRARLGKLLERLIGALERPVQILLQRVQRRRFGQNGVVVATNVGGVAGDGE